MPQQTYDDTPAGTDVFVPWSVDAHAKTQANATELYTRMASAESEIDGLSATSGFVDIGVRYVLSSGGSDSNSGISPNLAKATIQSAVTSLGANGGKVILSKGTHTLPTSGTTLSDGHVTGVYAPYRGVTIEGASRYGTNVVIPAAAANGYSAFTMCGNYSSLQHLRIGTGDQSKYHQGVRVTNDPASSEHGEYFTMRDVEVRELGWTVPVGDYGSIPFDQLPCGWVVVGDASNDWVDWVRIVDCSTWSCFIGSIYRGGGTNGMNDRVFHWFNRKAAVIQQRDHGLNTSADSRDHSEWWWTDCWFIAAERSEYLFRSQLSGADFGVGYNNLTNCKFEPNSTRSGQVVGALCVYLETDHNYIVGSHFEGGGNTGAGVPAVAVNIASGATDNYIGYWRRFANDGGTPAFTNNGGTTNMIWEPGAPSALADMRSFSGNGP